MSSQTPVPRALVSAVALAALMLPAGVPLASSRTQVATALGALTVSKTGEGTVASVDSSAINCGAKCRADLPLGTKVVLAATPLPGSRFDFWEGDCVGSATRCEVAIDAATAVRARFATGGAPLPANPLDVSVGGPGIVRSDSSGVIDCGTEPRARSCGAVLTRGFLTLRATPAADSIFIGWTDAPGCSSSQACRVDLSEPHAIAATFRRRTVPEGTSTLTVRLTGGTPGTVTFGSVTCTSVCSRSFANRSIVTLRALSKPAFQSWSGSCEGQAARCVLAISGSESVQADFETLATTRGAVNVTRSGTGRVESSPPGILCGEGRNCSAAFTARQRVTLTASTDSRHFVGSWGGAAGPDCVAKTCTVDALQSGVAVSVLFVLAMDDLKVVKSGDGEGRVTSSPLGIDCGAVCTKQFVRGSRVALRPVARSNSRFAGWTGACTGTTACSVVLRQSTSVTARFDLIRDEVRVTKSGGGGGTLRSIPAGIACGTTCAARFPRESTVELHAVPDNVSRFAGWSGACTGTGACSILLGKSVKVGARFERIGDELSVVKTGTGAGKVSSSPAGIACGERCDGIFPRGAHVVLTATPKAGSRFSGWSGACRGTGQCTLTMAGASSVEAKFARICAAGSATGFTAKVAKGPRRVLVTIRIEGKASARLRLFRAQKKVAEKTVTGLGKGLRNLRIDVPRGVTKGTYRLVLRLTDSCGGARTFEKTVTVPRRV